MPFGKKLKARFEKWQEQFKIIGEISGPGAMLGLELVKGPNKQPAADEAKQLAGDCLDKGLVILTCGSYGNIVRILAPLVTSDAQLEKGLAILEQGLAKIPGKVIYCVYPCSFKIAGHTIKRPGLI